MGLFPDATLMKRVSCDNGMETCCPFWLNAKYPAAASDCSAVVASAVVVGMGRVESAIDERRSARGSGGRPSVVAMIAVVVLGSCKSVWSWFKGTGNTPVQGDDVRCVASRVERLKRAFTEQGSGA
jgi:hypothetical protein